MELFSVLTITAVMIVFVFVPGYLLTLAIFPKKDDIEIVERVGLSLVLGLTPVFLLYAADKNFSIPIDAYTTCGTFVLVSLIGYGLWQYRKK